MIIFYCKKCAGKPYFTKEDTRPRDGRCPVCGGYLEERAVTQEGLEAFTPFNLMGKRAVGAKRQSPKIERQKPDKDAEKRKETRSGAESRNAGISTAGAVERPGKNITSITNAEEAPSERHDSERILPENDPGERNDHVYEESKERRPQAFKNTFITRDTRPENNGVIRDESANRARPETADGAREPNNAAADVPQRSGRIPHVLTFNATIETVPQQENVYRGTPKKIWDWLRYRQSFSDTFNTINLQDVDSEYLDRHITAVFYGQPISFTSTFGLHADVRIRGYFDRNIGKIVIRRMSTRSRSGNLMLQRSEEDRAAIRGLTYFILIVSVLLLIILNGSTIVGMAKAFLNFLKVFAVVTLISGAIVAYATRNNIRLRFRDKVFISVVCGLIFGALIILA